MRASDASGRKRQRGTLSRPRPRSRRTARTGVDRSWQAPLDLYPIWEFVADLGTARLGRTGIVIPGRVEDANPKSRDSGFDFVWPRFARIRRNRPGMTR